MVQSAQDSHCPFVVLGDQASKAVVHNVNVDYRGAGRLAVEYLAGRGHKRIAFLGTALRYRYQCELCAGFCQALAGSGVDNDERLICLPTGGVAGSQVQALCNVLRRKRGRPTAVFVAESGWTVDVADIVKQELSAKAAKEMDVLRAVGEAEVASPASASALVLPIDDVGRVGVSLLREVAANPGMAARCVGIGARIVPAEDRL